MDSRRIVYLDNAATTPVDRDVLKAMLPFFSEKFANPMTYLHSSVGLESFEALEEARAKTANLIGAQSSEIIFTSGGTEADNLAIKGVAFMKGKGHIITSRIEHHAVLHAVESLKRFGFNVTYIDADPKGFIDLDQLEKSIRDDTILISIMHSNNEIGTIQPIESVVKIARKYGILVHTDAVQSVGHVKIDIKQLGVDFLSVSAHKFNGPKGVGYLFVKDKKSIVPLIDGGSQEYGLRASTHNVPGIVGLGEASRIAQQSLENEMKRLEELRNYMYNGLISNLPDVYLNGDAEARLPQNLNVVIEGVSNEALLTALNRYGVIAAGGSACTSEETVPSHVLKAIGLSDEQANSSVRFSFGRYTKKVDIDYALDIIVDTVVKLRSMGN